MNAACAKKMSGIMHTSTKASRSQILDTDYGATTSSPAKAQILHQASTAMLAQANSAPGIVMMLLKLE